MNHTGETHVGCRVDIDGSWEDCVFVECELHLHSGCAVKGCRFIGCDVAAVLHGGPVCIEGCYFEPLVIFQHANKNEVKQ